MPTKRFHSDNFYGQNSGIEYHFELHDMSWSGSSTLVELDKPGAIIDWSQDSNIYSGIRASKCNVTIKVTNSTIETAIMNLIAKQDKTVYILIYKGADIYWGGALNSQGIQFEQNSNPPYIKLEAMDWLGGLQNIMFDPANFIHLVPGYNKFTDFLTEFFLQAYPLGNQFYMPSGKLFSTASPIYNSVTSDADDLWYNTQANTQAFTDEKGRYTLTYHQVLENFLTIINSKVLYSNGIYRVVDIRYYNYPGDWTEYFYNDIGNQTSQLDYDNTITYDGDDYEWSVDPLLEVEVALKKAQITFRNPSTLRTNPEEGTPIFQVTSPYMTDRFGKGLITSYLTYFVPDIIPNTGDKVEVVFDIDVTDPALLKKCKWVYLVMEVTDGTSSYWLNNINVNPTGVDPYTCTPADTNWLNLPNGYVIMPFNGGQKSRYRVIMDLPFAINNISRFEVNLGGDFIYKKGNTVNGSGYVLNIDTNGLRPSAFGDVIHINGTGLNPFSYIAQLFSANKYIELSHAATLNQTQAQLRIWAENDVFVSGDEGKINIDIQVNYLIGGSSTDAEGMKYEATNSNQANTIYESPDTYIGDATGATKNNRALKVFNGAFWLNSLNNWRYKPLLYSDTEDFLLQKLANSFLEHRADPLKLYSGILFIRSEYKPHQAIYFTINSVNYILFFNGGSFSLDTDEWSGQWVIINRNVGTLSATTKKVGTKITTKDIYKDIYPYIDVPILDNDIRVIGDIIGTSGGAFAMVKSAVILNAETMGNYTASDPEFTFQSTGSTAVVTNAKDGDIIVTNENGKFWKVVEGVAQEQFMVNKVEAVAANRVYAGPTTGAAANPTFRALVADDLASGGSGSNYLRGDMTWATFAGISGIGTIDSVSPKVANGAQVSGANIIMQTADSSYPGLVSIGTQTFAGAKTFSNNAKSSLVVNGTWTTSADGDTHISIAPSITSNANNRIIYAVNINPTMSNGGFTGVSLIDLNFGRSGPFINAAAGNMTFQLGQVSNLILRSSLGGATMPKAKLGLVSGAVSGGVTNTLDCMGDALFGPSASTPAAASARVDIVGSSASTGSALIVKNSTPTTLFEIKNNQDIQLGSSGGKIGLFAVTPIVRPTTSIGSATIVSPGGGSNIKTDDTFDGYTLAKVVKALRDLGILT